jgi:RNA polymerase sigma-70 factor (ECF subfamily)
MMGPRSGYGRISNPYKDIAGSPLDLPQENRRHSKKFLAQWRLFSENQSFMGDHQSTLHTRPSLLVRIRDAQDSDSWRLFLDIYGPLVYSYCRRKSLQDADAVDVVQEVMTEVARCIGSFEYQPGRGRFRDWLGTVTYRRLVRFWEKKNRQLVVVDGKTTTEALERRAVSQQDPEWAEEFNTQIVKAALERIRRHFEPATWQAFERVWLQNQETSDTAAELNLLIEAVYKAKSRVLKRLEEEVLLLAEDLPHFVPLS